MMDEMSNEERAERRKKELDEKEFENEIARDLRLESQKQGIREIREEDENKYVVAAILFFGTMAISYAFLFGAKMMFNFLLGPVLGMTGINLDWINPFLHAIVWIASIVSVVQKRSVLDLLIDRYL